jgi:hypothetical protein
MADVVGPDTTETAALVLATAAASGALVVYEARVML